ncbi:MAG: RNA-binding protein [bacterium]
MNIYVGNLAKEVTDTDLQELFSAHGKVNSAKVIRDIFTGESKGFGFVEMPSDVEAQKAINALNVTDLKGKKIAVNEARPKRDNRRPGGGGGRGGPRGGHGGGGGNRGGGGGRSGGSGGGGRRF